MTIQRKLLVYLTAGFVVTTIIGTLSHEFGHYLIAKCFGYDASIHYAYTLHDDANDRDSFLITLGGPVQTMLTGTVGFFLLFIYRKSFYTENLVLKQWGLILITLFWLRQTANYFVWIITSPLANGAFAHIPDEIRLARYLKIPDWSLMFLTGLTGVAVLTIITFKFVPRKHRWTFLSAGVLGGVAGFIFWIMRVGPIIMP